MGTKLPSSMSTLPIAMCVEYCKERQGRAEIKNVPLGFLVKMLSSLFFVCQMSIMSIRILKRTL